MMKHIILLISLLCMLTACGFHLRGQTSLPAKLHTLRVQSVAPNSAFTQKLVYRLQNLDVQINDKALYTLIITPEETTRNIIGVLANTQIQQYRISNSVSYQLIDQYGHTILPMTRIMSYRTVTLNSNQLLGSTLEVNTLHQEMRAELIERILLRLSASHARRATQRREVASKEGLEKLDASLRWHDNRKK